MLNKELEDKQCDAPKESLGQQQINRVTNAGKQKNIIHLTYFV